MSNAFLDPIPALPGDERRALRRYTVSCNALIRLSDTLTFRCLLRNVSREAAQVVCDARYALLVQPAGAAGRLAGHRRLEISIALPVAGTVRGFTAFCVAKYRAALEGDHMILGLKFVDLDRASSDLIRDYIASLAGGEH